MPGMHRRNVLHYTELDLQKTREFLHNVNWFCMSLRPGSYKIRKPSQAYRVIEVPLEGIPIVELSPLALSQIVGP